MLAGAGAEVHDKVQDMKKSIEVNRMEIGAQVNRQNQFETWEEQLQCTILPLLV